MKLNNKQILIIDSIKSTIETWRGTNDINSPTHVVDIHEWISADLLDVVSEKEIDNIETYLVYLLNIVRKHGTN